MNFLAHLWIADQTDTDLAGAVAADFVRGPLEHWPEPLRTGMALHRFIDAAVDSDPQVLVLKAQFAPEHRRMAGICLDLAFDHQLAKNWPHYHDQPLSQFSAHCYQHMAQTPHLPDNFKPVLAAMTRTDWLSQYQNKNNIDGALFNIALRLSKPQRLRAASSEIWRLEKPIAQAVKQLLPQLLEQAFGYLANESKR